MARNGSQTTVSKIEQSNAAILQILNAKNVELSGTGLSLWELNPDVKLSFVCTVRESSDGNKWLEPKVDGLKTEDGEDAKTFRLFLGSFFDSMETYDPEELVWVTVVQRVPRPKGTFTEEKLDEIDEYYKKLNAEQGRVTKVTATSAYRRALAEGLVTYVVDQCDEYIEE